MTDKPDPRPMFVQNFRTGAAWEFTIVVPNWCLDNQSQALTHDQLMHLTGRELASAMVARRRELEGQDASEPTTRSNGLTGGRDSQGSHSPAG